MMIRTRLFLATLALAWRYSTGRRLRCNRIIDELPALERREARFFVQRWLRRLGR